MSIPEAKVVDYMRKMLAQYYRVLRTYELNPQHYGMDVVILKTAIKRYLDDVERIHKHHDIDRIDGQKIAGYLAYWICKLKPIHIVNRNVTYKGNTDSDKFVGEMKRAFFINEIFALFLGMGRISASTKSKKVTMSKGKMNTLIYTLKFRHTTGDMLTWAFTMAAN